MKLNQFWAKTQPFQSIVTHGIVSGCVCRCLMERYLSTGSRQLVQSLLDLTQEQLLDFMSYLVSLHDIGKLEYYFQCQAESMKDRLKEFGVRKVGEHYYRHEKIGADAIRSIWEEQGLDSDSVDVFSDMIGAHHQKKKGQLRLNDDPFFKAFQVELEQQMRQQFLFEQEPFLSNELEEKEGAAESILLGIMILSDWIASGALFADAEAWIEQADSEREIMRRTELFLEKSGLRPASVRWGDCFTDVWSWISPDGMRPLQREAEVLFQNDKKYSLLLLEAPMGEGKTEAGLYCAVQLLRQWNKDGFYVALPTAATSNQMMLRLKAWFAQHDIPKQIRLLHGMAWMMDEDMPEQISNTEDCDEIVRWLAPLRRGLLGQFSVGTIDQVMLSVAKAKYGVLRLLGLSNKVLVIDEIHSYDVYMSKFIERLLQWCRALEIPVILLSATLPPKQKEKLLGTYTTQTTSQAYPLITAVCADGSIEEHPIADTEKKMTVYIQMLPILNDPEQIAQKAAALTEQGGCLCVLMNTVRQAQAVFSALKGFYDGDLLLFHAQFPAKRREEIEKLCIQKFGKDKSNRPRKAILVATQVVEQSLDVDFDTMLTAVAPIDLVLQRMGRIFRHAETQRPASLQTPTQWILTPGEEKFGADACVYPEVLLRQTIHVLSGRETVRIPEDLSPLVADGYDETKIPPGENEQWLKHLVEEQLEGGLSQKYLIGSPDNLYFALGSSPQFFDDDGDNQYLTVQTRLGEPSVRIALLEPELYQRVEQLVKQNTKQRVAPIRDKTLAREVLEQSVSVTARRIRWNQSELSCIKGDMLLAGIQIYPAENGCCTLEGGRICFDRELGVIIEEEKA